VADFGLANTGGRRMTGNGIHEAVVGTIGVDRCRGHLPRGAGAGGYASKWRSAMQEAAKARQSGNLAEVEKLLNGMPSPPAAGFEDG